MLSVLTQGGPDVEYLVVDPGSTDETPEIISKFQLRFPGRIIHLKQCDEGPADGLNQAFRRASGDIFGYLNADDFYLSECLMKAANAAQAHPSAAAIYADGYIVNADGKILRRAVSTKFGARRFVYGGSLVLQQSTFYRAEAFRAVGGFNASNKTSWDAEILLEMAMRGMELVHLPGFWSAFRIHSASITGSQRFAEASRSTHARYFERVMGRHKTAWDELIGELVFTYSMLAEPRATLMRVLDRIAPPKLDVARK